MTNCKSVLRWKESIKGSGSKGAPIKNPVNTDHNRTRGGLSRFARQTLRRTGVFSEQVDASSPHSKQTAWRIRSGVFDWSAASIKLSAKQYIELPTREPERTTPSEADAMFVLAQVLKGYDYHSRTRLRAGDRVQIWQSGHELHRHDFITAI